MGTMDGIQPRKYLLLTGAGFTANWGGKLARELWDEFYAHPEIRKHQRIKDRFKHESSFELALASGYSQEFSREESHSIENAVCDAFKGMDDLLSDVEHLNHTNIDSHALTTRLFNRMYSPHSERDKQAFFFTLNQDILLERIWTSAEMYWGCSPGLPGVPPCRLTRSENRGSNLRYFSGGLPPYGTGSFADVSEPLVSYIPDDFDKELYPANYIKLHGSFNWKRSSGGRSELVIGTEKTLQIHDSPLLDWYSSIFKEVLSRQNLRMMIIGYSFRDEHVNTPLFEAVLDRRLSLFVWDTGFDSLRRRLLGEDEGLPPGLETPEDGERILDAIQSRSIELRRAVPREGSKADFERILEEFFI